MPTLHTRQPGDWKFFLMMVLLFLFTCAISAVVNHRRRRAAWAKVLEGAHHWATSVGGILKRVSEQPPIYYWVGRNRRITRRYRITFTDHQGAECIATLQSTEDGFKLEKLVREVQEVSDDTEPPLQTETSDDGYACRHRAKTAHVPVIFAPPRHHKPPRRST